MRKKIEERIRKSRRRQQPCTEREPPPRLEPEVSDEELDRRALALDRPKTKGAGS